jgi:hypothetical protein
VTCLHYCLIILMYLLLYECSLVIRRLLLSYFYFIRLLFLDDLIISCVEGACKVMIGQHYCHSI